MIWGLTAEIIYEFIELYTKERVETIFKHLQLTI